MISILGLRESGWFDKKIENKLWNQTAAAYNVKDWLLLTNRQDLIKELENRNGERILLNAFKGEPLSSFVHPKDAIYVFGNAKEGLLNAETKWDYIININSIKPVDMFAHVSLAAVLYDREVKRNVY